MIYLALSLTLAEKKGWSILIWLTLFFAAVVPFAFLVVEFLLRKESAKEELAIA
jgi:hypothetical protein